MKTYKVVVFPSGTEISFEIFNALKYVKFIELYGANSITSHADYVYKNNINSLPFIDDERFVDEFNRLIDDNEIDFIYPAHDEACLKLMLNKDKYHAIIISSPLETVKVCRSKKETYKKLIDKNYVPIFYDNISTIKQYPVFVKPSIGQGSVGTKLINTKEELDYYLKNNDNCVICEYLPGEEYTIDCFTNKSHELLSIHMRNRERIRMGISVRSKLLKIDDEVLNIAKDLNENFVFNGAWFFQVKKDINNRYKLMEVSPRIPGTMALTRNLGINYPLLTIYNFLNIPFEIIENSNDITIDRAFINRFKTNIVYDTVYIDFDDTILNKGKINSQIMMYLYQCVNNKKRLILLTKHKHDIIHDLLKNKICPQLFDDIISIDENDEKYKYIKYNNSIFIDDSFSERKKIKNKYEIPTFDLDMVESLLDWKM